jgi:Fe-S-cluster containining protein
MSKGDALARGLVELTRVKGAFVAASDRAARSVRSCADCDARCCKVGFNSMLVTGIEAAALARRLSEPDLAPLVPGILERARAEVERRALDREPGAKYDCPLLSGEGRCLVHGPAQPAGCLTYRPVPDGGCDHDLPVWHRHSPRIDRIERRVFGRGTEPRPIPVALLDVMSSGRGPARRGGRGEGRRAPRSPRTCG